MDAVEGRGASSSTTEKSIRVIRWKFDQLDRSRDGQLSRRELRGQKRLIKKLIQPLACARRFNKNCDLDKNNKIDRREWVICLSVDINGKIFLRIPFLSLILLLKPTSTE